MGTDPSIRLGVKPQHRLRRNLRIAAAVFLVFAVVVVVLFVLGVSSH